MSRNSKRTTIPQQRIEKKSAGPQPVPKPPPQSSPPNPFGMSFVVPTEIVHLPSGGNFYDENSSLNGIDQLEIKAMTAKEEDILVNDSFIENGVVFDKLIDSLMITPNILAKDLLDCDKIAVLISARKTGYGDTIEIAHECPECNSSSKVELKMSTMLEHAQENAFQVEDTDGWVYEGASKTLLFSLPVTDLEVRIRLMTPTDFEYLRQSKKQKEKLNLPFNETVEFIRNILVSANGVVDPTLLTSLLGVLPAADARRIKYVHNINIPTFDTKQKVSCPDCSAIAEREVPFSVGWFWSD